MNARALRHLKQLDDFMSENQCGHSGGFRNIENNSVPNMPDNNMFKPGMSPFKNNGFSPDISSFKNNVSSVTFRISVIITCYKPDDVVDACVKSFAEQNMASLLDVVLVNDCSPYTTDEYQSIVNKYKDKIHIQYLKTPENCGPGDARQYGYDNAEPRNEYVLFHDADELCNTPDGMTVFFKAISKNGEYPVYVSGYIDEYHNYLGKNGVYNIDSENNRRITGNVYKRSFLEQHNIRFCHMLSYHDEDAAFLSLVTYCLVDSRQSLCHLDSYSFYILWEEDHKGAGSPDFFVDQFILPQFVGLRITVALYVKITQNNEKSNDDIKDAIHMIPFFLNNINFKDDVLYREKTAWYAKKFLPEMIEKCKEFDAYINYMLEEIKIHTGQEMTHNIYDIAPKYEDFQKLLIEKPVYEMASNYNGPDTVYKSCRETLHEFIEKAEEYLNSLN